MSFLEEQVATLLEAQWNASNTNSRTPTIQAIYDIKRANLWDADYVLTYSIAEIDEPNAFGDTSKKQTSRCRIDVRSKYSLAHLQLIVNEVRRILDGKRKNPFGDWDVILPTAESRNLSDRSKRFFRYVMDYRAVDYNKGVTPI